MATEQADREAILKAVWPELVEDEPEPEGAVGEDEGGQKAEEPAAGSEEAPEPVQEEPPPEALAEPEGEPGEAAEKAGEEEEEAPTLDSVIERHEALKAEWEARREELIEEGRRKAQSELQPRIDRANEFLAKTNAAVTKAVEWIGAIAGTLNQAVQQGALDAAAVKEILASNPEAYRLLTSFSGAHGFYHAMRGMAASIAQEMKDDAFAQKWVERWTSIETGAEGDPAKASPLAYKDMMAARDEWLKSRTEAPLRKRIATLEAELEKVRLAARKAGGPDTAEKASVEATLLTPEAIEAMSDEEYNRRLPEILKLQAAHLRR